MSSNGSSSFSSTENPGILQKLFGKNNDTTETAEGSGNNSSKEKEDDDEIEKDENKEGSGNGPSTTTTTEHSPTDLSGKVTTTASNGRIVS